jgi:hypothetical protein
VSAFPPAHRRASRDAGLSLIEILIAIVLLGGVIAGTMATLRAATIGGTMHRDHSRAHAWLQSSSDILYASPKVTCSTSEPDAGEGDVRSAYDWVIDHEVPNPPEWKDWQIRVVPPIQFWNAGNLDADPDVEYYFGSDCDPSLSLQLIRLEVKSPSGQIIETVEIVK